VNVADLKNGLSRYLREVRRGEEILIKDRNVPIAKIIPLSMTDDLDAHERALVASGQLRPGKGRLPESFWSMPAPRIPLKRLVAAVADREED
jgi:prevent-host-death family protein